MRHHSTSIVGPDIDGNEQAVWAKMFPYHTTPVKDAPSAQPSVGERLAKVAFETMFQEEELWYDGQSPSRKRDWLNVALAVRREVLREDFTDEDVQAARREHEKQWGIGATSPSFCMKQALSAALASRVARESKVTP